MYHSFLYEKKMLIILRTETVSDANLKTFHGLKNS